MCTLSVQLYSDVISVNLFFVFDKTISAILCVLYFLFLHFCISSWKTCQLMWKNIVFLFIFDTCDVIYYRSLSLLPPIVLSYCNLFANVWSFRVQLSVVPGLGQVIVELGMFKLFSNHLFQTEGTKFSCIRSFLNFT